MSESFNRQSLDRALLTAFLVFLAVFVAGLVGLGWRGRVLRERALDGKFLGYDQAAAAKFFNGIGEDGRLLYAWTAVSLDLLYPLSAAGLIALGFVRFGPSSWLPWVIALPALAVLADWGENLLLASVVWTWPGGEDPEPNRALVFWASGVTRAKWALFALAVIVWCVGFVLWWRQPAPPATPGSAPVAAAPPG